LQCADPSPLGNQKEKGKMSSGFEVGRVYNRRGDIHARFGGQQQGGIITPKNHPLVIIITGEEGLQHGYADRRREDGVFEYFGEGQLGDMQLTGGNKAIAEHSASGESLLLFRKADTGFRFEGEMVCESFHYERSPDRKGNDRSAIVFELRPLEAVSEVVEDRGAPQGADLAGLLAKALAAAAAPPRTGVGTVRTVYERSRDVRDYVLARAGDNCEGCETSAPFKRKDGSPYLEPHHIRRLSDGGPDHPAFVIALCPNCHRRVHAGADGTAYNAVLLGRMTRLQPQT
jgi:5-methylcytosine-specific restriction protein A